MQYLGGKKRIAKYIANYINQHHPNIHNYYEPFCGMCSVGDLIRADFKYFSDNFKAIITLNNALVFNGFDPVDEPVTEDTYKALKDDNDPDDPYTAYVGFGCSFGGKYFGGFARSGNKNFAKIAKNSLKKIRERRLFPNNPNIFYLHRSYHTLPIDKCEPGVFYCDPPYKGTTGYKNNSKLDYNHFYKWCEKVKERHAIYISEYSMPRDRFECVLEINTTSTLAKENQDFTHRIEKLWTPKK